jgi:hypothetical protein
MMAILMGLPPRIRMLELRERRLLDSVLAYGWGSARARMSRGMCSGGGGLRHQRDYRPSLRGLRSHRDSRRSLSRQSRLRKCRRKW